MYASRSYIVSKFFHARKRTKKITRQWKSTFRAVFNIDMREKANKKVSIPTQTFHQKYNWENL